jgi:hypothetical protein
MKRKNDQMFSNMVDAIPIFGQAKGLIHWALGRIYLVDKVLQFKFETALSLSICCGRCLNIVNNKVKKIVCCIFKKIK